MEFIVRQGDVELKQELDYLNRALMKSGHPVDGRKCPHDGGQLYYAETRRIADGVERDVVFCATPGCKYSVPANASDQDESIES